jgi:hypothetical protein
LFVSAKKKLLLPPGIRRKGSKKVKPKVLLQFVSGKNELLLLPVTTKNEGRKVKPKVLLR